MINSTFGKFCEDLKRRRDTCFLYTKKDIQKALGSALFQSARLVTDNCLQVNLYKSSIELTRPHIIGATILDVSKACMIRYVRHCYTRY